MAEETTTQPGTEPATEKKPDADLISRAEANKAFKERDKAKALFRTALEAIGVDTDSLEVEETGDKEHPYKIKSLDEVAQLVSEARKNKRSGAKWEDREKELAGAYQKQAEKLATGHKTQLSSRDEFIRQLTVSDALRSEAAKFVLPDAIDDVVRLLESRIKVELVEDEETKKLSVKRTPLNEDGTIMLDPTTQKNATLESLMKAYVDKRPHLRSTNYRNGPGAGGHAKGARTTVQTTVAATGADAAAKYVFGNAATGTR